MFVWGVGGEERRICLRRGVSEQWSRGAKGGLRGAGGGRGGVISWKIDNQYYTYFPG